MKKWLSGVAGGLMMCCLVSNIQAAEAQNAYVSVSGDEKVYRLEQRGETDFDAYSGGAGPATFTVGALGDWELVAPAGGSVTIAPGGTGGWKVKSKLNEDKPDGKIYLWNYFIKADEYNAKNITVPFGKTVKYRSHEGAKTVNSDWDVSDYEISKQKNNTDSIIFNRSFWDITEWLTESYPTPQPGVYTIKAHLTGNPSVNDTGLMTVVGAEFIEHYKHPYGFDDYSNWSLGPTDYYKVGTARKGHCTLPYASVREGYEGMAYLTVDPDSNTKAIPITSSASELALNPETTATTTDVGFTPSSGWFPQNATVTAKMDDTTLAKLDVISYQKKTYTCLIVNVISRDSGSPLPVHNSVSKYNSVFNQAVIEFFVTAHDKPFVYRLPRENEGIWKKSDLYALKIAFCAANPETSAMYNFIVFNLDGLDEDIYVNGRGDSGGRFTYLYAGPLDTNPDVMTAPHEMGHNFGLSDIYTLSGAIPISDPDRDNLMNSPSRTKLRKTQWTTIREHHTNIGG